MTYAIVFLVIVATTATYHRHASASKFDDDNHVSSMEKIKEPALPLAMDSATAKTVVVNKKKFEGHHNLDAKNLTHVMITNTTGSASEEQEEDEDEEKGGNNDDGKPCGNDGTLSAVWYLAAFGGLVLFFFVVTCSELFMQNPVQARRQMDLPHASFLRRRRFTQSDGTAGGHYGSETPPPPYHLFAPPRYDDLIKPAPGCFDKPLSDREMRGWYEKNPHMFFVPVHHAPPPSPLPPCNVCPYHPDAPLSVRVVDEFASRKDSCEK